MRRIIIDCDPGHDDAVAMLMALAHPELLDVLAVTTVCGNNTIEKVTRNARIILDLANGNGVVLAAGAMRPLVGLPIISEKFHGKSGMDGHRRPAPIHPIDPRKAVCAIRDILLENSKKVTLVALGPLTNLAIFIRSYPELCGQIEAISLMGGALVGGNHSPHAEFNIAVDPESAEIVFSSGIPIVMSGLDVTQKALIFAQEYEPLRSFNEAGKFFSELMDFYIQGSEEFGASGCVMHDPCAVAWLLQPEIFSGRTVGISVDLSGETRGKTKLDEKAPQSVLVLEDVDRVAMRDLVISSIKRI
ncbi:MAG: nucleoside hydrolase [Clostridiales bacterium]|nr:nucleoside hydrolase [Clostridiales bacterium]